MKRLLFPVTFLVGLAWVLSALAPRGPVQGFDLEAFSRIPVLANGRIKPLDTLARTSLLQLEGRQAVYRDDGTTLTPTEWLLEIAFRPARADELRTLLIDDPEVQALVGQTPESIRRNYTGIKRTFALLGFLPAKHRRFTFNQLQPHLAEVEKQAHLAEGVDTEHRTRFQRAVIALYRNLVLYQGLKYTFVSPDSPDFFRELAALPTRLPAAAAAIRSKEKGEPHDEALLQDVIASQLRFEAMASAASVLAIPPEPGQPATAWEKTGTALNKVFSTGVISPAALAYSGIALTWQSEKPAEFNEVVRLYRDGLAKTQAPALAKAVSETRFNAAEPFYRASVLFIGAFLLALVSWLRWSAVLAPAAFGLATSAWVVTTAGIVTRMCLEGRPPVTNLYSSALFVGWVAVALCLVLERIFRNTLGTVTAGAAGFCALIIAHNLSLSGDTLEMMRAVLDSNFWLATHVVTITVGYGATFLAGLLALLFVLRGLFTRTLDGATADALRRMVYGIVCFATLFSLVGTILGGIWADQSWGRFWGWDPKENGALLIVIWNALILHARWGGLVRTRGLMALALFGNCVTAWSWFGTNMLGVGLHSYGFMDAAFAWLVGFEIAMVVCIGLACLPSRYWRSKEAV